jgi:hypothetical protein
MVKRRHKPISESGIVTLADQHAQQKVGLKRRLPNNGGTAVAMNASADVPMVILGIIGHDTLTVSASSTAKWGTNRLRVALVLDNTGSMAQSGKMPALQAAADSIAECR